MINWTFTDRDETYVMNLENSALTHRAGKLDDNADAGVKLTRAALDAITLKQRTFVGSILTGDVSISGNPLRLRELFGLLDDFTPDFEIVEPKKAAVDSRVDAVVHPRLRNASMDHHACAAAPVILRWPDNLALTEGHIEADDGVVQRAIHEVVNSADDSDGRAGGAGDGGGGRADLPQYSGVGPAAGIGAA